MDSKNTSENITSLLEDIALLERNTNKSSTIAFLGILITLSLINLAILIYSIYRINKIKSSLIEYMQNYLSFHTRVIASPIRLDHTEQPVYKSQPTLVNYDQNRRERENFRMSRNESSNGNINYFVNDYGEYEYMNNKLRESGGVPRSITQSSTETTSMSGYIKNNNPIIKTKIGKRFETKSTIKRDKSNDSIVLKMKRSESWDTKSKIYTNMFQMASEKNNSSGIDFGKEKNYQKNYY
ncbi:unnamed protein product [Brachionus calyciflorus]|uniref:Uncharacterized protein n=1 Tax=Brachionus calyciflorus TaxID=104777 RepID=A0A813MCI8_9BILA|nr:unnamed protein product [Brachionus calyciflorus]